MELQTSTQQNTSKLKVSTLLGGLCIVMIPLLIGILINMPQVMEWIKMSTKEIVKGSFVGVSTLPVMLFVTIKGGSCWYKRWWTWGLIIIAIAIVLGVSFLGEASGGMMTNMPIY